MAVTGCLSPLAELQQDIIHKITQASSNSLFYTCDGAGVLHCLIQAIK